MEQSSAFTGTLDDVNQEPEAPDLPLPVNVPVSIDGPVQVHLVSSVSAGSRSWTVGATAQRIANADPRRRSVTIISMTQDFHVGATQNECDSEYGPLWPKLVPLVLTHSDAVYVKAATETTAVSAIVENWAS